MRSHARSTVPEAVSTPAQTSSPSDAGPGGPSLLATFERLRTSDPHRMAVVDDRSYHLSRAELARMSEDLSAELRTHGVGAGDVVIVCMPNWTEWMAVYIAVLRLQAIPATLPVTTDAASIAYVADLVGA